MAAQNGHVDICRELIDHGASIDQALKVGKILKTEQKSYTESWDPRILNYIRDGKILEILCKKTNWPRACFTATNV